VMPYVRDTRNVLLLRPLLQAGDEPGFLESLAAALARGLQAEFQVDERELDYELIGREEQRAILFLENAEGSLGVLENVVADADVLSQVARAALDACHFDEGGEDQRPVGSPDPCVRACYRCLLSYTNQPHHVVLNRHLIAGALRQLAGSRVEASGARSRAEQYRWLKDRLDPQSKLEAELLEHLYRTGRRLPDHGQWLIKGLPVSADFYYADSWACVFCDGSVHDAAAQREKDARVRSALKEKGYRVVVVRYDEDLEVQVQRHEDVFGAAGAT